MKSARARFQENKPENEQWMDIVSKPLFAKACDAALLAYIDRFPPMENAADAVGDAFRVKGARDVLKMLAELPVQVPEPKVETPGKLNYKL